MALHVTSNLAKELDTSHVAADAEKIAAAAAAVGPFVWRVQECSTPHHVAALRDVAARHGLTIHWPGGEPKAGVKPAARNYNPVLWTSSAFRLVPGSALAEKTFAGAAYSPARYVISLVLEVLDPSPSAAGAGSELLGVVNTHEMHQAFTTHTERQPIWVRHMVVLNARTAALAQQVPLVVGGGDLNHDKNRDAKFATVTAAHMLYAASGTFGRWFYDALWFAGDVATPVVTTRLPLASDHDALFASIALKEPVPVPEPTPPLRTDLVDISHHQDFRIDYPAARNAGVRGMFHKVSEGQGGLIDPAYTGRRAEAAKGRLLFGGYHYGWPSSSSGREQAQRFLKAATVKPGDLRPMLDLEEEDGFSTAALSAWVGSFVAEVKAQLGVAPIIYTPFDLNDHFGCPLWVARYNPRNDPPRIPKPWSKATIRQFSNGEVGVPTRVAGFPGKTDLNTLPGGVAKLAGLVIGAKKPPGPVRGVKLDQILQLLGEVTRADALDEVKKAITILESIPPLGGRK